MSDGKPYQTLCVCDYVFRQAEKYLMQFCSLFVVIQIKMRNASQFSHSLGCGAGDVLRNVQLFLELC